jgi:hypothetical protein
VAPLDLCVLTLQARKHNRQAGYAKAYDDESPYLIDLQVARPYHPAASETGCGFYVLDSEE